MKFQSLDQMIEFEKELKWVNSNDVYPQEYELTNSLMKKYESLKGEKYLGIHQDQVVAVVSDQFRPISVEEVCDVCDEEFGCAYTDKSFREGIARIYQEGVEDRIGKVTPMVIYAPNLGSMAVNISIYHNAFVCSNGLIMGDSLYSNKLYHRTNKNNLEEIARNVTNNLGIVMNKISAATETKIDESMQLAMIIQGLEQKDGLIKKAMSKYAPEDNSLWSTIQTITYVARDEKSKGFNLSKNAGQYLVKPSMEPHSLVEAASYAFTKEQKGEMNLQNSDKLFSKAQFLLGLRVQK